MDALSLLASSPARARLLRATGAAGGGGNARANYLPEDETNSALAALRGQAGGALEGTFKAIDTPGALARGFLVGDPASGFSWDADRRVTGKEMLEKFGVLSKNSDPYYAAFAGLAAEIATDPLSIISGPLNALTKAGKAAKAVGILGSASDAALATMGIDRARDTLQTGRNAYKFLGDLLPMGKAISKENAAYRPLVGPRVAQSSVTLEQTIQAARNPTKAMEDIQRYLAKQGIKYDSVKGEKLGGAFGLDYFGLTDPMVFNPQNKVVRGALDLMDAGGQMAQWSAPTRFLSSVFDQRVGGRKDSYDQIMNLRHWDNAQLDQGAARATAAKNTSLVANTVLSDEARRLLGADNLNSTQGGDFLTRLYENVPTQGDMRLRAAIGTGKTDELVRNFDSMRQEIRSSANSLGMVSRRMKDPYGVEWNPRLAREADFADYGKGLSKQTFYARSLENEARKRYLMTPGGTTDLRQINLLPEVQQFIREGASSTLSEVQVGAAIKRFLDYKHGADTPQARAYLAKLGLQYDPRATPFKTFVPKLDAEGNKIKEAVLDADGNAVMVQLKNARGNVRIDKATGKPMMVPKTKVVLADGEAISQEQANRIARFYMRKDKSLAADVPMFSEHPLASQSRAVMSQATARTNADTLYTSLSEAAMFAGDGRMANALPGTGLKSLDRALNEAAQATGLKTSLKTGGASKAVQNILKERIAARTGKTADEIDLAQWSVPEKVLTRLTAVNDFYSRPRAQDDVMNVFGQIGQIFRGFLLAFPSRFTRDIYSNGYQLWTLGRNPGDVAYGLKTAMKIVGGKTDEAAQLLRELPGYTGDANAVRARLTEDVARTGILKTLASNDLLTSSRTAELNQLVPGMVPQKATDFVKELIPDGSRNPLQMVGDYFTFKGTRIPGVQKQAAPETRNALLNASQKLNDYTDSVSRLGGMLMLMRQGVSADEAARRVTEALVDYSSLTAMERSVFKSIFPWWSYTSRAGKYAVKQLVEQPGGPYAQTLRAFNRLQESDENTYVPEALRQQFAVRVPDSVKSALGIGKSNTTTFLRDIDIPGHDVISTFSPGPGIYPTVQGTFYNMVQQSNPLLQAGVELATGTDLFSRRPLQQADSSLDRIYKAASGSKTNMNPVLRQALELIPAPRISGIVGGMVDPRIPIEQRIAKTLVNTLTGVKLQDVDPAYQYSDARRILAGQLGEFMKDYTESYIPKDTLAQVPEEMLPQYALFRSLGKRLREQRGQR